MSFVFINAKGEYLSTGTKVNPTKEVRTYKWVKTLEKAEVFNTCDMAQFASKVVAGPLGWSGGNSPYRYILGIARVEINRTVTMVDMRGS